MPIDAWSCLGLWMGKCRRDWCLLTGAQNYMGLQMEGCHKVWWWLIGAHKYVAPWMQDPQAQKFIVITARKEEDSTVILTISHFGLHFFKTWNPLNRIIVFLVCVPFFFFVPNLETNSCMFMYFYLHLFFSVIWRFTFRHQNIVWHSLVSIIWYSFGTVASTKSFFSSNPASPFLRWSWNI